jgi:hypothetical protein
MITKHSVPMDAMKAAGVKYGVNGDVIVISFDACKAGLTEVPWTAKINADFQCNPLQGPDCAKIVARSCCRKDSREEDLHG